MRTKIRKSWEFYKRHIANWDRGKVSQQEYCRKAGIPLSTFQYWKSKLGKETGILSTFLFMAGKERRPAAKNHQSKNAPNAQAWILCFLLFMEGKERRPTAKTQIILLLMRKHRFIASFFKNIIELNYSKTGRSAGILRHSSSPLKFFGIDGEVCKF